VYVQVELVDGGEVGARVDLGEFLSVDDGGLAGGGSLGRG
jgi:hypothetical protein